MLFLSLGWCSLQCFHDSNLIVLLFMRLSGNLITFKTKLFFHFAGISSLNINLAATIGLSINLAPLRKPFVNDKFNEK